jgi:glycosyltransferase involved in cell wall biosynthesis
VSLSIVHVIARLNVGGAALHVLQLAHEQSRRGHDVIVVAGTLAAGEESMEYVADELGIRLVRLPVLQRELSPRADSAAILALRRLIRRRRPDVLHTHTAKAGATGRLAALASGRARPRARVHTYHGHVLSGYFSRRWEHVFRWIERLLAYTSGLLIAVSDEVRDELVGFGVAPARRFVVVPYGFDPPPWSESDDEARHSIRAEIGAGDETFVVGWVGRLTSIKRPLDLVRTLRALVDLQIDALLVLVGDGEDRAEVEALGAGRPVVATRAGGTGSVVLHGESGYLEPIGDTAALAERLAALALDLELRARLGTRGAEDVRERFSVRRMADEVETVYRRLLE